MYFIAITITIKDTFSKLFDRCKYMYMSDYAGKATGKQ